MDSSHPHYHKARALVAKAVKMSKKALLAEIRALRKELMPGPLGKMGKVALINEYVNAHLMKEVERAEISGVEAEEIPKEMKPVAKRVAKRAEMTAAELIAHKSKKREPSAKFKQVAELMRKGHKMAEAWKMVKTAKPEEKPAAPVPASVAEPEAPKPKSTRELFVEEVKRRRVARKSDAIRAAPHALEDAPHKQLLEMIRTFNKSRQDKKVKKFLDLSRDALVRMIEKLREDGYTI